MKPHNLRRALAVLSPGARAHLRDIANGLKDCECHDDEYLSLVSALKAATKDDVPISTKG